jgi:hypothetical protein
VAKLDMDGPFDLTRQAVQASVTQTMPGTFAIGHKDKAGRFQVQFVGRDDANLGAALMQAVARGIGRPGMMTRLFGSKPAANAFKFSYATSAQAAYEKQCRNFHNFGETRSLENPGHPAPPAGSGLKCPVCGG